jgi:hypothetical protein
MLALARPLHELTRGLQCAISSACRRAPDGGPLFLPGLSLAQW